MAAVLVLTRKKEQSIVINENIEITILDIQGDQVRVGVNAPKKRLHPPEGNLPGDHGGNKKRRPTAAPFN